MEINKRQRILLKGVVCDLLIFALQFSSVSSSAYAAASEATEAEILKNSQLSYRAEGGFTGVESYGVILSCVNGQVSTMKSISDPRLGTDNAHIREIGNMDKEAYLDLWKKMDRHVILKTADAPHPQVDIADEFTVHFHAKVGSVIHEFQVYGIARPEASRYFAIRKLIDDSVQMSSLWATHQKTAQNLDPSRLTENFK